MLELHIDPRCERCRLIQQGVRKSGLAHEVVEVDDQDKAHQLVDQGHVIRGHDFIQEHLSGYLRQARQWHRFTGDYCSRWELDDSDIGH